MESKHRQEASTPNITLKGHKAQPTYALGWGTSKTTVASGSQNGEILVWDLENHLHPAKGFQMKLFGDDEPEIKNNKTRSSKAKPDEKAPGSKEDEQSD